MKRLFVFLLALSALLAGCSGGDDTDIDPSWEAYRQEQEAPSPTPEEESPAYPAAFSLAYHQDLTLDPITCGDGVQQDVASLLYEPLFALDESFEPVPVLCEDYSWDESGLVCTLRIRQGVLFHDGSTLSAADVAASLRRAAASERYGYRLRQVTGITADRNGQVVLTLSAPNQGLISLLDIPIVKQGTESQQVPVGTGPYLFVTGSDGDHLQASGDWWQQKSLPVDTIPLVHAKDQDTATYLFSSHRVELLTLDPTESRLTASSRTAETERPTTTLQFIGFNTASEVFSAAEARRAFNGGLQREMLTSAFLSGHAQPVQFPIPASSPLYPADLEQTYSYEGTLSALRAAGYDTGETRSLTLLVNEENSFRLASAEYIADSLSLLDWEITVQALPWEEYLQALSTGAFDLYLGEVRLTADWDLTALVGTGGEMNYGGYTDVATDVLLQSFQSSADRAAAARQLCQQLQNTAPIAPICFRSYTVLTHTGVVEGLSPTSDSTFSGLENWVIHLE